MSRRPALNVPARSVVAAASAVVLAALLAGCVPPAPEESARPTATVPATTTPTEEPPAVPVLVPDGTAADNLPLFSQIVSTVWAGPDNASGRAYVDALAAAGFDKAAMQVTEDFSTVGNRAESLQFSVLWGPECLVGQVGPATGDPVAVVVTALAEGGCLIGSTRPIDW